MPRVLAARVIPQFPINVQGKGNISIEKKNGIYTFYNNPFYPLGDAPTDGNTWGRQDGGWTQIPTLAQHEALDDRIDNLEGTVKVYIGDAPPAEPKIGQMWWQSSSGATFIYYYDGNSYQWVDITGSGAGGDTRVNVRQFGAVMDGATDDTGAIQACADYCRDNNLTVHIPDGLSVVTSVTFYGAVAASPHAVFLSANDAALTDPVIRVGARPEDIQDIPLATVNAWTGIVKGSTQHADFAPYYNKTVTWYSNDERTLIRRGEPTQLTLQDVIRVHDPDGSFYPPILTTKAIPWASAWAKAITHREQIVVTLPTVRFTSGVGERATGVVISRPNTTVMCSAIENLSSAPIQQGFSTEDATEVTFVSCSVTGLRENVTNYGWNHGRAAAITHLNCNEMYCRRGLDAHMSKLIRVIGGSYPDGVGGHWVNDLRVSGGAYIASDAPGSAPIYASGGNVSVHGCTIKMRGDQTIMFGIRSDLMELTGAMRVDDCDIEIDCNTSPATDRILLSINATTTTHDWGRLVEMPNYISLTGNRIRQLNASFTGKLHIMKVFTDSMVPPLGMKAGGDVYIARNQWDMDATPLVSPTVPRLIITALKTLSWIAGAGYNFCIDDLPALQLYLHCAPTHPTATSAPRNNLYARNLGSALIQLGYGAWQTADWDARISINQVGVSRPGSGYATPVGDEVEVLNRQLYAYKAWNPISLAHGAYEETTITVPGAAVGDFVFANISGLVQMGWLFDARVTATNVVTVRMTNNTGGVVDLASGTLIVKVLAR